MLVFIDESGDAGFKIEKGSSKTFVMALIIFDEDEEVEKTALKIKELRRTFNKSDKFEFKFNKCNKEFRLAFLNEVKSCNFKIRAAVFHKERIYDLKLRSSSGHFYNYALRHALGHEGIVSNAKIRIDGSGDRRFRLNVVNYLKLNLNSGDKRAIANLRFCDSNKNVLIQLADMVAGSIRKYFDETGKDWELYRKVLKKKEENVCEYGKVMSD